MTGGRADKHYCPFWLMVICLFPLSVASETLNVGKQQRYQTVKEGVEAAHPFDTVYVHKGVYHDHTIRIKKPLTLIGQEGAVIDAEHKKAHILVVISDSVTIRNLTLQRNETSFMHDFSAIRTVKSHHGTIRDNRIKDSFFGIYLQASSHYLVKGNYITGSDTDQASAGNAIHLWKSGNCQIVDNRVEGHRDGIYFEFVEHSTIHHNTSRGHMRYGLHFMFSNHDVYHHNQFINNGAGVAVMYSKQITMTRNLFAQNRGGSSYGLLLKEINYSQITRNRFKQNTVGITAEGSNYVDIDSNELVNNGKAMDIKGNCVDIKIVRNNFIANTFEIITNSAQNRNTYSANYWSQYTGYDLDDDGTGDVPHRPLSLYAKIINEIPASAILIHSFFVDLLDMGERIFPTLIAEELVDPHPKMHAYTYDIDPAN